MLTRSGKADTPISDHAEENESLALIEEADRLAAALSEHQERELPEARAQLEEALRLEGGIPGIRADAAAGRTTAEQVEARIGAIRASLAAANERSEDAERLSAELRRRIAEAGRAAIDATLAEARRPLAEAARAQEQAKELLEQRRSEYELALAHYRQVERDADAVLARYDRDHAKQQGEQERRKEERIRWALRQPRFAIEQLPVALQQEAYERYDRLQDEAAAHRKRIEEGRYGALVNPRDAAQNEIRL